MTTTSGAAQEERATFKQSCAVSVPIGASPEQVWKLLTDADGFSRWNSTITSIVGPIAKGQKLQIRVPVSPRTFTPRVIEFTPGRRMVWADGNAPVFRGVREFDLAPSPNGTTFNMKETISGVMLPMIRKTLPDFGPIFEAYARDLKAAAEAAA